MRSRPLTESERLFAESCKYGEVIMLLPMPDGRFCILGARRTPEGTYGPDATIADLEVTIRRPEPRRPVEVFKSDPTLNLDIEL